MKIHIIGSGIIGLFSAYYLNSAGFEVMLIDQTDGSDGCSYGNAGMIVPSHFIPLAAPGMVEKGIRWMFDSQSPFYVKPRLDWAMFHWGLKFLQSAKQKKVNQAMPVLRDLGLLSKHLYQEISAINTLDFGFEQNGLLMLCKKEETLEEEVETAHLANALGIEAKVLNKKEIDLLEPEVKPNVVGGVLFTGDTHCMPNLLVKNLKAHLKANGVAFLNNCTVKNVKLVNGFVKKLEVIQNEENKSLEVDQVVLAAGSWSEMVSHLFQLTIPVQAGKGYSFNVNQPKGKYVKIPSILLEARVAVTPFQDQIRFGGTMELGGINNQLNLNRVKGIVNAANEFYPDYNLEMPAEGKIWQGLRPCSPDGLPYIGRSRKIKNLIVATGHAMMGISLAPATGKMVSEIAEGQVASVSSTLLDPERFD